MQLLVPASLSRAGDIASLFGVLITVVGFCLTLLNVRRSRLAAAAARDAANDTKRSIEAFEVVADLSKALTTMEEIRRLHRAGSWEVLPDRYSFLKQTLISIKNTHRDLPDESMKAVQGSIVFFTDLAKEVEKAIEDKKPPKSVARMNTIVSSHLDSLYEIFIKLKNEAGTGNHGDR